MARTFAEAFEIYSNTKKKKPEEERNDLSFTEAFKAHSQERFANNNDIAPVRQTTEEEDKKWYQKIFKGSEAFDDGWDFGDGYKTAVATTKDLKNNIYKGLLNIVEGTIDTGASIIGDVGGMFGATDFQDKMDEFAAKEIINKDKASGVLSDINGGFIDNIWLGKDKDKVDELSVSGDTMDGWAQSGGQLLGVAALGAANVPWWVTTGVTSYGNEFSNALNQGATHKQASLSGLITAGAEVISEKISGGIKFGGTTWDDWATKRLATGISNRLARTALKMGIDIVGEGGEEIFSGLASAFGQKISYASDKEFVELFSGEDALEAFVGGAVLGGASSGFSTTSNIAQHRDATTGLTANEEAVFKKVYEDAVAEAEKGGKKLTNKQKNELYDNVMESLKKGEVGTDTIESVLGGDTYKSYKETVDRGEAFKQKKASLQEEFDALNKMKVGERTGEQTDRLEELRGQIKELDKRMNRYNRNHSQEQDVLKSKLSQEVQKQLLHTDENGKTKYADNYLIESYNERARRSQKYEADLSKYDAKQQEIVKKAIESGILNNTRRTHELVDMIAKISADKGVSFDFINNKKLKESGFAIDGKTVNGYYSKATKTIGVNIEGAKYLNSVVGHEVTHVLEGTEVYTELQKAMFEYAKSKGEYDSRRKALEDLYKAEDIDSELTADLVGDYLFTDSDFIKNLSVKHRNVFQKIYDEIKYLCKVATAGSKEAKELERVKKLFEEAYREGDAKQKNTVIEDGVQYALADMEKITPSPEQVDSNMQEVAQMSPVCVVDESKLAPNGKDFKEIYGEYFIEWGENIHTDLFGDIAVKKSSIRSEIRHGSTAEKIAAIEAIPSVIQNGKIVDWIEKQRGVYRIIVAAPISIGDTPYVMGVMLQRDSQYQRLYLHDVVIEKEASISSQDDLITTGSGKESDSLYTTSILQKILDVKRNSTSSVKNSLSSIANTFFGDENMSAYAFQQADYKQTQGYKDYVEQCVNNYRQTRTDFDEVTTRKEIEDSIDGIIQVAVASKKAGYDIYDDATKRDKKDSKNRLLFSSLEPNSDYFTSSDISTICDKRQNFAEIYDDIVRAEEAKGVPKGKRFFDNVDNYFYLHKLMADKGLTQPCRQCYVESMRKNLAPMANAFIKLVGETDPNNTSNDQLYEQKGKKKGEMKANNAATREWVREKLAEYDMTAESLNVEMLTTEDGLAQLKIQAPLIYEAFNSFYGQSKPKMPKSATPFRFGELTALLTDNKGKIKQSLVNKINSTGGFRLQSYSDFQIQNYTDVLQVIFEAGTLGLNGHAYTKVPAFLDATEGTNLKRNISIFMYKDGNEWKLDRNDSFPYSLQEIYDIINSDESGNTSIIAVSQNNEMSAWIMANDNVGYGIPFHKSGMKMGTVRETIVKEGGREIKGYSETKDHTKQQTEVWAKTTDDHKALTKVKKGINIYSFWDFNNADGLSKNELIEKNVKAYIDACEDAGYIPKFRDYVMNNGKVLNDVLRYSKELGTVPLDATIADISFEYKGYTIPYGYYKFLGDFGMFTPDGNASPQQALSLKNYDFAKAVEFFADSETLRRNEVLQQFSNGEERQKYRDSDLTAEQLMEIVKQKRGEIAQDVVDGKRSLSMEGEAPSKYGNISGDDVRLQEAPTQEAIAPIKEEIAKTATTTPTMDAEEEAEAIAPVANTEESSDVPKSDNLERAYAKIDEQLEQDKVALAEEFEQKKETMREQLKDKNAYISNRAKELYNELSNLKKGVRASKELGYLLDHGFDWNTLKSTLLKVSRWSNTPINPDSVEESTVREMLNEEYDGKLYDLDDIDNEYQERVTELDKRAEKEKGKAQKAEQRIKRAELHQRIVDGIKAKFTKKGLDLDEALKNAKDLSTFATVDNTPQRVMEKSLGYKAGQTLADETINKVAHNETEGIKWLNSYTDRKNGLLAKISKQYNIKPGSKESAAAQMYAEGFYVAENGDRIEYGDFQLAKDFPDAKTQANIKGLASDTRIREIYDETLKFINESRARNGYPEIPRLDNYFLHFRAMDDTFSRLGLPFNPNDIRAKDLPTDLNGVTADLKPGQPYFASAMHRRGQRTSHDLIGGLERYLSSAKNQIYHIDDIQTFRALRNYIADSYGQAKGLESLDALTEEEAQERIKQVYDSHLSTFAKFLNEEANILAGKTSLIDRGLEGIIGRRGITFLDTVNKQVGSNMVGFNVSSALTNLIAPVQAFAKTNKVAFVKGFAQTISNRLASIKGKGDGFAENSPVMIRRQGADRFARTPFQKVADAGYSLMGAVDSISTEIIARAKYNELTAKGMASDQAHIETDKWVSRLMGDRSLGQMPQLYNSKMLGLVTKFQLEVRNQLDSQFYDTIQEAKASNEDIANEQERNAKTAAKVASTFVQLAVAQHLFGQVFESIAGYNPTFDIIEALIKAFGLDDDEEDEDTALDNIEQGFLTLLEDMPYASVVMDGGRIPISSALPIGELITGEDEYGEKSRLETLGEIAPYYVLPGGFGQIKKSVQGLSMFSDDHPIAGSYTDSGNLRFPVEDTFGNRVKAGIFGQWSSKNARDYFENERSPLNEKQIKEYADVDLPIAEYWDYREGLSGLNTLAEKADYINSLDIETWQKNLLLNNIANRKTNIDLSDYKDYSSFEEFDFAKNLPGMYALSKAVASNFSTFKKYAKDLNNIRTDKDENGKPISGSRKEKVIDYINSLEDTEYGERIILYKAQYKSDNTYNADILEYLNSRNDLTYEERVAILKELGFKISSDGKKASW